MDGRDIWSVWGQIFGCEPEGLQIVIDSQVAEPRGELRCVPLFHHTGCRYFTYPQTWRTQLNPIDYEFVLLHPEQTGAQLVQHGHLVQVLSQDVEDNGNHAYALELIATALAAPTPKPLLVLVLNSQDFHLQGTPDGKSLIENYGLRQRNVGIHSYETIYRRYKQMFLSESPLSDGLTRNPWFHWLAIELKHAGWGRWERLVDLFDFTVRGYPLTPGILRILRFYLEDYERRGLLQQEGPDVVRRDLRPWLERGEATAVAERIWWGCNAADFDLNRLLQRGGVA